jgi:hypothetical protein
MKSISKASKPSSYLPVKFKVTILSCLPAILLGWMILSDKLFVNLLIFNPAGSLFYGFLGYAFCNKTTTILYSIAVFALILLLLKPMKKLQKYRE